MYCVVEVETNPSGSRRTTICRHPMSVPTDRCLETASRVTLCASLVDIVMSVETNFSVSFVCVSILTRGRRTRIKSVFRADCCSLISSHMHTKAVTFTRALLDRNLCFCVPRRKVTIDWSDKRSFKTMLWRDVSHHTTS